MRPYHFFIIAVLLGIIGYMSMKIARAHDPYTDWKVPGTAVSCCDQRDCRPTRARMTANETWQAWDGDRWVDIPSNRVLRMQSPDGRSHLCEAHGAVFCFVAGPVMH